MLKVASLMPKGVTIEVILLENIEVVKKLLLTCLFDRPWKFSPPEYHQPIEKSKTNIIVVCFESLWNTFSRCLSVYNSKNQDLYMI